MVYDVLLSFVNIYDFNFFCLLLELSANSFYSFQTISIIILIVWFKLKYSQLFWFGIQFPFSKRFLAIFFYLGIKCMYPSFLCHGNTYSNITSNTQTTTWGNTATLHNLLRPQSNYLWSNNLATIKQHRNNH